LVHATARVKLSLAQVRLAPGPGHAQNRQRAKRVELAVMKAAWKSLAASCIAWSMVAVAAHA
jgi:hypothetical protein